MDVCTETRPETIWQPCAHLRGLLILAAILAMLNWRPKGATPPIPLLCCSVGGAASVAAEAMGERIRSCTDDSFSSMSSASAWVLPGFPDSIPFHAY